MHIHILGICGTFMGGLALIARAAGHRVTGCDANVYPPMSTQLEEQGIELIHGYGAEQTELRPDLYIVGNVVSRGNPLMEAILDQKLPYTSGPQWLGDHILRDRHVLAVSGTHGKTTTSSMLAWILTYAKQAPSFLIGGIAQNLGISAYFNPESPYFVIEADEYDTAFFDKRSKFVHYHGRTVIMNNLEFDHADIFPNVQAIETQFHHMVRTIAQAGLIIYPKNDPHIQSVLERGCYSHTETFGEQGQWQARQVDPSGSRFEVWFENTYQGSIQWTLQGHHNRLNALAAIAAAHDIGIHTEVAIEALNRFQGIKRRMELKGIVNHIAVYDDFAHHPTAIASTLEGVRQSHPNKRILAVLDPHSNTMKLGTMAERLPDAVALADVVFCYHETQGKHKLQWSPEAIFSKRSQAFFASSDVDQLAHMVASQSRPDNLIIVMSNGGFGGFHHKLLQALEQILPTHIEK